MLLDFHNSILLEEVESTNEYIKSKSIPCSTYILANSQTKGKGRKGKTWVDLGNEKIIFSGKISFNQNNFSQSLLPLLVGGAVLKTLQIEFEEIKNQFFIKWPNDIFLNKEKVSGILIESEYIEDKFIFILGIGINLSGSKKTDTSFAHSYISANTLGKVKKESIIKELIKQINVIEEIIFDKIKINTELNFLFENSIMRSKQIKFTFENTIKIGIPIGFDENGFLLVKSEEKIFTLIDTDENFGILNV